MSVSECVCVCACVRVCGYVFADAHGVEPGLWWLAQQQWGTMLVLASLVCVVVLREVAKKYAL